MSTDSVKSSKSVHLQPEWVVAMGRNMQATLDSLEKAAQTMSKGT
jgi:hypothetical protein